MMTASRQETIQAMDFPRGTQHARLPHKQLLIDNRHVTVGHYVIIVLQPLDYSPFALS